MATAKKLTFAPFFLISCFFLISQLSPVFKSADLIFSLSLSTLIQLIVIAILINLSGILYIIFAGLALDWKIVLPIGLAAAALPFIFFDAAIGLVLGVSIFVILLLSFLSLDQTMKTYLTFQPASLFGAPIRHLAGMFILIIAVGYFLGISKVVSQNGFQIPDTLIDTALKFAPLPQTDGGEQLEELKKNPDLLKQAGLDPKILDSLPKPSQKSSKAPQELTNNLIKQTVKDQIQNFIKPYINFIPAILALLLFLTLQSLTSIINLLIYPVLWLIFLIMEKTGFIKFTTEMRPVKKMVI